MLLPSCCSSPEHWPWTKGTWAELDLTGERPGLSDKQPPGVLPPALRAAAFTCADDTAGEGNVGRLLRLVLQCFPVSSWIDKKN